MYKYDEEMSIEYLPATAYTQLVKELSNESAWKLLAENVAEHLEIVGASWLNTLEDSGNSSKKSAENLLFQLNTRMCTVGILSTLLEDCNLLGALSILRQPEPLIIEQQPNASGDILEVALGTTLKLICRAKGLPPPKYAWYHNNTKLENRTSEELSIKIENVNQQGEYRCKVLQFEIDGTRMNKKLSSIVYVRMKPTRIEIEKQPIPFLEVRKGDSFTLDCLVKCHPVPKYQWFRDNTKLEGQNTNVLRFDKFDSKHEGKYHCYITNEVSEACTQRSNVIIDLPREKAVAKIALLIANEDYEHQEKLGTPKNDVTKLAHILEEIGFKVVCLLNLNAIQMRNAIRVFCSALIEGVYGFFYFAGHGFKMQESYMLPIDAPKSYLRRDAVCESELLAISLSTDPALLVVVLDTCQTVPPKECNPEIHAEIPKVNEYGSGKNLRNLIQAYSTSSHRPSYERQSNECGLYLTHLSKYITRDMIVQKVFEETAKSIDVWFKGKERNQIPMFALTVTKPFRLTDAMYHKTPPPAVQRLIKSVEFPTKSLEVIFQQAGVRYTAKLGQYAKPFLNSMFVTICDVTNYTVNFHNSVPMKRINLFKSASKDECWLLNPQSSKGPIVVSLERNGKPVSAILLPVVDHVPAFLRQLDITVTDTKV
ncbi:mucosa-associated lymphoid tissue lymphoma translocation protein 1-like isoform X2 [Venturia canescens]|uniref:mucosa-associated lymphoid tissue lymphoma translocation protein 1-like isoform X2 n=1 Tax=Venturia canescens TaxID=32260 RepID=UPI001C9BD8E7|nr:mucosa-associated lymphoid tissue lymphoma translocation protein 1-like isoform X2 [Venturia canescens]